MKREEAIKIVKSHYPANKQMLNEALEFLIPELQENNDEKIRKALIERITEIDLEESVKGSGFYAGDYDGEEICDWLERQGDKDKLIKELGEYKVKYTQEVLSQQLEKQDKIDKASYEIAEKEKYDFVSGKFIKSIKSFDVFKEDNSYWLEYVGNDNYIGRSDNILNQKFHITPRQLYSLFAQECCSKEDNANAPVGYGKYVDECLNEASEHFFSEGEDKYSVADLFYAGVRCGKSWFENQNAVTCNAVDSSDDDKIRKGLIKGLSAMRDIHHRQTFSDDVININDAIAWLEKQDKQEQLYIRFGEIPTDEKSKIYQGEIEVGTENGVSVYPAFKTDDGDIVLGLNLPITKTTLYTQQHLIEYDDRPCYLVKGDYVSKDTDGQPLINNVSIVEKIDRYRVKEEKQGEQKLADKVEPKFKVGDWVVYEYGEDSATLQIKNIIYGTYEFTDDSTLDVVDEDSLRLWTIQDAKEGDVLANGSNIFIFHFINDTRLMGYCHVNVDDGRFYDDMGKNECFCLIDAVVNPATKEQRDILFQKMKEAGYEFDFDKKELKKTTQKDFVPKEDICEEAKSKLTPFDKKVRDFLFSFYHEVCNGMSLNEMIDGANQLNAMIGNVEQKPTEWSEEDEKMYKVALSCIVTLEDINSGKNRYADVKEWLKSFKERVQPQPKEWSDEDEAYKEFAISAVEDYYDEENPLQKELVCWLKSFKDRLSWKPSKEQMNTLLGVMVESGFNYIDYNILESLYDDLKKL